MLQVQGICLTELAERESSVLHVSELDSFSVRDPVINAFRMFSKQKNVAFGGSLLIASESFCVKTLVKRASGAAAQLLLLP